jgi:glycosyltransferase involved in cell wall biosynthesis
MKIAMLGLKGVPYPAGIEAITEQIGWRLVERGHEVTVYNRPYVVAGEYYRGMKIRRLPSLDTKHFDTLSHTFLSSFDVLSAGVDIVHVHALGPSVFSLIPRLCGIKTIVHVHALDWKRAKWNRFAQLCLRSGEYAAAYFPHRTIVISSTLKDYFEGKFHRRVDVVPNSVDLYDYRPPQEIKKWGLDKENYILFLARLVPEKGCHYLIEAFEKIATPIKLVIAGESSHTDNYAAALRSTSPPGVIFTGLVGGAVLEELYSNAYFYVLPSELEGSPLSLLEAMSFGRCPLTSDIPELVEPLGGCGLTFKNKDAADLRGKIEFLLRNPDFVRAESRKARARVIEHYIWDRSVDRLEQIYAECLNGFRR